MWKNLGNYPLAHTKSDHMLASCKLVIGASGAVSSVSGAAGVAAANGGTGVFNITYPKSPGITLVGWALKSAAGTVKTLWCTAYDASAGTMAITTGNGGGTATNPANGDEIHLQFDVQLSGVD